MNYILEGMVRHEDDRVRVTAQFIRVGDQTHVWAESHDRELSGILEVQNELAKAAVLQIRITLSEKEQRRLAGKQPVVPEAPLRPDYIATPNAAPTCARRLMRIFASCNRPRETRLLIVPSDTPTTRAISW